MNKQTDTPQPSHPLKSIGAVFAGLLVVVMLSTLTDIVMHAMGVFPPWFQPMSNALFGFALAYRIVYTIIGGYVTAKLAPRRPMMHGVILAAIGLFLGIAGAVGTWNKGPEFGPKWYPIAIAVTGPFCVLIGVKVYEARKR